MASLESSKSTKSLRYSLMEDFNDAANQDVSLHSSNNTYTKYFQ